MDVANLIVEREKAHGDWNVNARACLELFSVIRHELNLRSLHGPGLIKPTQEIALYMIAVKMARILAGDPSHADHWDDIAGYAELGKQ